MVREVDMGRTTQVAVVGQTIVEGLLVSLDPIVEAFRTHGVLFTASGAPERNGMSLMGGVRDDIVIISTMVVNVRVHDDGSMDTPQGEDWGTPSMGGAAWHRANPATP